MCYRTPMARAPMIVAPGEGRIYAMGPLTAVFKADCAETVDGYSISEWWLEPNTRGPGEHSNPEEHIFYVIAGTLRFSLDGEWSEVGAGGYVIIPGGVLHDFENRSGTRAGFISINVPGGFEERMPAIEAALSQEDLTL